METNEMLSIIGEKEFLDKLYGFAYQRCSSSCEAEDLCSDIVLAVLTAVRKQSHIENFYGFIWTVARRVYADFCEKRNKASATTVSIENSEFELASESDDIEAMLDSDETARQLKRIYREIAFLSREYRDVMVMFYLDEMKIKCIAEKLSIPENTVKQRLFSARNTVRKEVNNMENKNLSLKPVRFWFSGTGTPVGNDPSMAAHRTFSQNLIYLVKDKAKTAHELSEELCVPMLFIEEELEIQCAGQNGEYGTIRKLENGKYIANIIVADYEDVCEAREIFGKRLPEISSALKKTVEKNKAKITEFPFLSKQDDTRFILWPLINRLGWKFVWRVTDIMAKKHFAEVKPVQRPYSLCAIAFGNGRQPEYFGYGFDGICANEICGFKYVDIANMYGPRLDAHFHCGHNIANDKMILLLLRSIGGIKIDALNEDEKEIAAKAIECGYIRKNGGVIEPNVLVFDKANKGEFNKDLLDFDSGIDDIANSVADELAAFMKKHIPEHLMNEYGMYPELIAGSDLSASLIEECIKENILTCPESRLCGEGVVVTVAK